MHSRQLIVRVVTILFLGVSTQAGAAAGQISAGVQGNWGSETDFGVGARALFDLSGILRGLQTVGSFDYFLPSAEVGADNDYWEINANLVYRIGTKLRAVSPYTGVGFNVAHFKTSTEVLGVGATGDETRGGLNLLGGLTLNGGRLKPFVEARVEVGGGKQFVATAGVRF
jgi:hypothetical protein